MYLDFEKYGLENFNFETIENCELKQLDDRERYWIQYYNTYNNGYNLTQGGQSGNDFYKYCNEIGKERSDLTAKQHLVFWYLLTKSFYQEGHYYVYKNSFMVKDVAKRLKMSENTWRSSIRELRRQGYIWYECEPESEEVPYNKRKMKEKKGTKFYIINFPEAYVPLDIELIKTLVAYGTPLPTAGGTIVSVYSMICRYYDYCQSKAGDKHCYLNIGQIRKVFSNERTQESGDVYRLMISIFQHLELVEVKTSKQFYKGGDYTRYEFIRPKLKIDPSHYIDDNDGPENIEDIVKAFREEIQEGDE